jgi:hypothetical protein
VVGVLPAHEQTPLRLPVFPACPSLALRRTSQRRVSSGPVATSNITPPLGMEIVGNFAPRPIAKHVHDELHVRCLVLDDGTTKLAFAVADTISLGRDVWDEAKKRSRPTRAFRRRT